MGNYQKTDDITSIAFQRGHSRNVTINAEQPRDVDEVSRGIFWRVLNDICEIYRIGFFTPEGSILFEWTWYTFLRAAQGWLFIKDGREFRDSLFMNMLNHCATKGYSNTAYNSQNINWIWNRSHKVLYWKLCNFYASILFIIIVPCLKNSEAFNLQFSSS